MWTYRLQVDPLNTEANTHPPQGESSYVNLKKKQNRKSVQVIKVLWNPKSLINALLIKGKLLLCP